MLITTSAFKRLIPHYQSDAQSVDDYFFWERGKSTSVLSHFQQELRKIEGYAILSCIRKSELNTLIESIKTYNSGNINDYVHEIVALHEDKHGRDSVLLNSMNVEPQIASMQAFVNRELSRAEVWEIKKIALEKVILDALKSPNQTVDDIIKNATNSANKELFLDVKLSPFIEAGGKTARNISDEYVVQKNNFRNGYLKTPEKGAKKSEFVLGWEYLTDFVDKKIGQLTISSDMRNEACSNLFKNPSAYKLMQLPEVKDLVEKAEQDFEQLNRYRKLKSAIVQFREHGGDFTKDELLLKEEMLQRFVDENKPEIIKDIQIMQADNNKRLGAAVKKSNVKISDVHPPEIFLPVIPIVEAVNRVAKSHDMNMYIYDSGQKGFSSLSRKVKQEKYDGVATKITDGIRNTISYGSEAEFESMLGAVKEYLDKKKCVSYSYKEEVSESGYLSRKIMVPIKLEKDIEFSPGEKVSINATRVAELKFTRSIELALKKETDFLYHIYRQLCPENAEGKRMLMPTQVSQTVSEVEVAHNQLRVTQILGELHDGLKVRPKLVEKIRELNNTSWFNFPLDITRNEIPDFVQNRDALELITSKIQKAEKMLNCQNLNKAPIETQAAFYKAAKQSRLKPEEFFDQKSLEALQKGFKTERLQQNIEKSAKAFIR